MLLDKKITLWYLLVLVIYNVLAVTAIAIVSLIVSVNYEDLLLQMPLTIPAFIGTGISILISFKFNQSYDRWWEARKVWGSIVNDSRSFVIQLLSFAGGTTDANVKKMAYRQIAWCYALGRSLRGLDPLEGTDIPIIIGTTADIAAVKQHRNMPFFILEKSASLMQEPFENRPSDTAVTAIARTIEINIRQLLKETDVPPPHQPEKFFLT